MLLDNSRRVASPVVTALTCVTWLHRCSFVVVLVDRIDLWEVGLALVSLGDTVHIVTVTRLVRLHEREWIATPPLDLVVVYVLGIIRFIPSSDKATRSWCADDDVLHS